jgi:hypothetical protein
MATLWIDHGYLRAKLWRWSPFVFAMSAGPAFALWFFTTPRVGLHDKVLITLIACASQPIILWMGYWMMKRSAVILEESTLIVAYNSNIRIMLDSSQPIRLRRQHDRWLIDRIGSKDKPLSLPIRAFPQLQGFFVSHAPQRSVEFVDGGPENVTGPN